MSGRVPVLPHPLVVAIDDARDDVGKCTVHELPMARAYWHAHVDAIVREQGFGNTAGARSKAAIDAAVGRRRDQLAPAGEGAP